MIGGMHRQIYYMAKYLNKDLIDTIVLTSGTTGNLRNEFTKLNCKLIDLDWKKTYDIRPVIKLINVLNKEKPDVIFITEAVNFVYFYLASFVIKKKPVLIGSYRALNFWKGNLNRIYNVIDIYLSKLIYHEAAAIIVNSYALKKHYSKLVGHTYIKQINVIYNGVELKNNVIHNKNKLIETHNLPKRSINIVMIARLDPWKDFETLFKAIVITNKYRKDINYILVGGGVLRQHINNLLDKMNLKMNVFVLGERQNVHDYINLADICVLSTNGEGLSNSIIEAMQLSKPVIATDVGGNKELIGTDNLTGVLVPPKAPDLFASAILGLCENKEKRLSIGRNGCNRIKNICNMNKYIENYEKIFTQY